MTMVRVDMLVLSFWCIVLLGIYCGTVKAWVFEYSSINPSRMRIESRTSSCYHRTSSGINKKACSRARIPARTATTTSSPRWMATFPDQDDDPGADADEPPPSFDAAPKVYFPSDDSRQQRIRKRVAEMARKVVFNPLANAAPMPKAVAAVLKDATMKAVDMAVEEVMNRSRGHSGNGDSIPGPILDVSNLIDEAFLPLEQSIQQMEDSLAQAKESLNEAKLQASEAMEVVQAAAMAQTAGAATAVAAAEEAASEKAIAGVYEYVAATDANITGIAFEDVDYATSEMAPPFLDEASCLVPGEPVIRVEKAPENSRRIFAGIDIMASVDDVWKVMTDYGNLQNVVPNLVVNEVMELYESAASDKELYLDSSLAEETQCQQIAEQMKGALLHQVGGAKVAGINFSARTTLEVREWPQGLPDFAHFNDEVWQGKSRKERAKEFTKVKLARYRFPRPFAVSSLPTKDISMQSIEKDDGEFRMYQGVWRMQPLPGCAPSGKQAMRLSYAVEVSPRAYLPVQLIERRIAADLCSNLVAIRDVLDQSGGVRSSQPPEIVSSAPVL